MPDLSITREEALNFFPLNFSNLDLIHNSKPEELMLVYFQKNEIDKTTNKKDLQLWLDYAKQQSPATTDTPKTVDYIYLAYKEFLLSGQIKITDKMLLGAELCDVSDKAELPVIKLDYVRRNKKDDTIKGITKVFYKNITEALSNRGYEYLILMPYNARKLIEHWEEQGLKPLAGAPEQHLSKLRMFNNGYAYYQKL